MKKVVTMGGGGGHSQVLKALKNISGIKITGICPSTDSGGSTGVLLEQYEGNGYTGDLTKCIVALSNNNILQKALSYRYENGPLHSHSVKNLLFHALEKVSNFNEALTVMCEICGLGEHRVIPVTNEKTELCASLTIGNTVMGETNIDTIARNPLWNPSVHSISDIYLKPEVKASNETLNAISEADYIIICPGDLYSSLIPTLLPLGVKEVISGSKARLIIMLNIMTKKGETDNYTAKNFIENIEKRMGKPADSIICNDKQIPDEILLKYSLEQKVEMDIQDEKDHRIIMAPLATFTEAGQIYSDPEVIRQEVQKLFL